MTHDARFYFTNLGADVARCISAIKNCNNARYENSLSRAYKTLAELRKSGRPEAYEEGLLMLVGLSLAKEDSAELSIFQRALDALIGGYSLSTEGLRSLG